MRTLGQGMSYLFNDKVKILTASFNLVANLLELDLGPLLQSRFDRHLEDLVFGDLLPVRVETLGLDLHPLFRSMVQIFEGQRERALHGQHLGLYSLGEASTTAPMRPLLSAATTACARERPKHVMVLIRTHAAHVSTVSIRPHKVGKDLLRARKVVTSRCATASREVKRSSAAAAAAHAAKVETVKSARHATAKGIPRTSTVKATFRGWRGAAQEKFQAVLVVDLALLRVREDLVGLRAFFEPFSRLSVVLVLVGMPLQGGFSM